MKHKQYLHTRADATIYKCIHMQMKMIMFNVERHERQLWQCYGNGNVYR